MASIYQKRKMALPPALYPQKALDVVGSVPIEVLEPVTYQGRDHKRTAATTIEVSILIPDDVRIKNIEVSVELEG